MKKVTLIFAVVALMISTNLFAQRTSDVDNSKDYPLISRFEESIIEFYKEVKWESYQLPVSLDNGLLEWDEPVKLEGKLFRSQYSVSAENNTSYVVKRLTSSLEKEGFKVVYGKNNNEMEVSISKFVDGYLHKLGNTKCGYAYDINGAEQGYIMAQINKDGKDVFVSIYISGFNNVTLITQTVIEAENYSQKKIIATVFKGSSVGYDDKIGFNNFTICTSLADDGKITSKAVEGYIRNRFCYLPEGHSLAELITNYEEAITGHGGKIFVSSQKGGKCISSFMEKGHPDHGLTNFQYILFSENTRCYLSGMVSANNMDNYVVVVGATIDSKNVYSLVTIEAKPMEKGMVSVGNMDDKITKNGHIAIYDIHFETGKYVVMDESTSALNNIGKYLNAHKDKKFYIVGHTDNVGDFEVNKKLSQDRANAVMNELVTKYGVNSEQLKAYGVANLSPVVSNSTDKGKGENRRVEIVEQ